MIKKVIILSGGFDPIHSGHINMFKKAKELADWVVVCVNSDAWLKEKKGVNFLGEYERLNIVKTNRYVDDAFVFEDDDYGSAINGIKKVISSKKEYQLKFRDPVFLSDGELYMEGNLPEIEFIFGNGGDRNPDTTPTLEQQYCMDNGISMEWNLGGPKMNSSSSILENWKYPKTERSWGYYRILFELNGCKVKELAVKPNCSLSLQKHNHRSELWFVTEGRATVKNDSGEYISIGKHQSLKIGVGELHQLINFTNDIVKIVEIQYGEYCVEEDIIRF